MTAEQVAGSADPATLVRRLGYRPGWTFRLGGPNNRFLCVSARTIDSQRHGSERVTQHMFEIPDRCDDLERWVFDRLLAVEFHEAAEFFTVDGVAPFFPHHQDDGSPYELVDRRPT